MTSSVLTIGTLSLAGMVTTALFVVPMVGDNVAEKAAKRDEDTPALVLASVDDDNDDADDIFGVRITAGTDTGTNTGGPTTGPGTDTGTGGATTGPGTDTGTGGVNSGPGNAEDGHHADRSGPSGPDNSGPGNAEDTMTMGDDNSGSGHSGGDDSGGGDSSGHGG
jgi:hypothetical protein